MGIFDRPFETQFASLLEDEYHRVREADADRDTQPRLHDPNRIATGGA
ncbi:MAG: hypothetical protein ACRDS9_26875 [Pseudonocardiaceae bacterium]